ncbi:MAG: ATP-binding protein [Bacteroidia bacterium]|nr:ATP-binding protein [Bacteroidia bacterium]
MDKEPIDKMLQVNNQVDELTRVAGFLEELGEEWGLAMPLIFSLNLVLEEALTNIISYGYDDESMHTIKIYFRKNGEVLSISIIDDGHEYDPTLRSDPDITLSAEERPVGGLGIFLIKKVMDNVEYQRKENQNYLILTKNIKS